jgi:hypothetical protein
MNIYIYDNKLFCGFWNMATGNEDGGQEPTFISVGIEPNTKYFVTWRFDYTNYPGFPNVNATTHTGNDPHNNLGISGTLDCYVNGVRIGHEVARTALYAHGGDVELGWNGNSCWETNTNTAPPSGSCNNEPGGTEPFNGKIFEVIVAKSVPDEDDVQTIWNYINDKWDVEP